VQFSFVLPVAGTQSLTFTATDPDGDMLLWQAAASGAGQAAVGLNFNSPVSGSTFTINLSAVLAPAATSLSLLVEDPSGAAAAIDVQFVRSGAPTITGVTPSSAFVSAPQEATISGAGFLLGGAVNTAASFGAAAAGNVVALDDNTLTCMTPAPGLLGANSVGVQNAYGSDALPGTAFAMYQYPVELSANDSALDGGAGSELVVASDGPTLHAIWVEGGALVHQRSLNAGATWSSPQTMSSGETPSELQLSLLGDQVVAAWVADGEDVLARASSDGGLSFDAAITLDSGVAGVATSRPRLARAGSWVYCAWSQGSLGLGEQRVHATATSDNGGSWQQPVVIADQGVNQEGHVLGCDETAAWVALISAPVSGAGVYTSRSSNGGLTWAEPALRSAVSIGIGELAVCDEAGRVSLVWTRDGQLEYLISTNSALGWQTQPTVFRPADLGPITDLTLRCDAERLFAVYLAGGVNVAFSRVGAAGALPEHVTLSVVQEGASAPELRQSGGYLFAAWRGGDVSGVAASARVKFATSVDFGVSFTAPTLFGDGTAPQDEPRLLVDGARVWVGWLDYRLGSAALFSNRTQS